MRPVLTLAAAQLRADLRHQRTGKPSAGRVATTAIAYGFSGAVLALSLGGASAEQALFVGSSFGIVLAAFGVVGSYDELMGRPRDNAWLATLPATEGQHYGARLLGILFTVVLMAAGVAVPVGLRVGFDGGAAAGLVVGAGIAGTVAWTALASLAVLWGLTLALPQKTLRLALSAARTVLVGALVLGFQTVGTASTALDAPWWPGAWVADAFAGRPTLGLAAGIGSVLAFGALFGAVFPRRYFRLLRLLADGARQQGRRVRLGRGLTAPERWAVGAGPARAAYGFAVAAFADDRLVRGRLWPAALLPAGFVVFGWLAGGLGSTVGRGAAGVLQGAYDVLQDPETQLHLSVLVVLLFCVQSLVQTLQYSDHAPASWVFGTLPGARPRVLQLGAQSALVWRVLFPLHVGVAVLLTLTMPAADAALHAWLWFAVGAAVSRLYALAYGTPPFSRAGDKFNAASRFVPLLVSIPMGVAVLLLQTWALATLSRAAGVALGLLAASAIVGQAVAWRPRRPTPRPMPAAAPAWGPGRPLAAVQVGPEPAAADSQRA